MPQSRTPEIDRLYQDVASYRSVEKFRKMLKFIRRFRHIAPYNAMLVYTQRPGSRYVASARDWQARFGRTVKPGARPLVILQPFGPVSFVYEYRDTIGESLPKSILSPARVKIKIRKSALDALVNNLKAEGICVNFADCSTDSIEKIAFCDDGQVQEMRLPDGICRLKTCHVITISRQLSVTKKYAAIIHALGRLYCGHIYHNHNTEKWLPDRFYSGLTREQQEFEAETVCWLVCERLGLSNPAALCPTEDGKIPDVSIDAILKAAGTIESIVRSPLRECRKELIVEIIRQPRYEQCSLFDV